MVEEYEKGKKKRFALMRSLMDYGLGVSTIVLGIYLFLRYREDMTLRIFSVACVLYGAWRIYRGYKKNYFQ